MKYIRTEQGLEQLTDAEYQARFPQPEPTYIDLRLAAYGSVPEQLEYIVEHGLDDFITRQQAIKDQYPKS